MPNPREFEEVGFLSESLADTIAKIHSENVEWFSLVEDLNHALMATVKSSMIGVKTTSMAPNAVAVRVLMRSCGALQGAILLTERGMVAEARMLARSLTEDAFCIAALLENPDKFMEMLKADSEASRRQQGQFIIAEKLVTCGVTRDKLQAAIDEIEKADIMSPKKVAALGPLKRQYLAYQRLSDDSAHTSAKSLQRYMEIKADRTGWSYRFGIGDPGEIAATLHHLVLAALPIGVGITQMLNRTAENAAFGILADRFAAMPPVPIV